MILKDLVNQKDTIRANICYINSRTECGKSIGEKSKLNKHFYQELCMFQTKNMMKTGKAKGVKF